MKPSERIKEIVYAQTGGGIGSADVTLWAIAKYLDEQWEKEQVAKNDYIQYCHICEKDYIGKHECNKK